MMVVAQRYTRTPPHPQRWRDASRAGATKNSHEQHFWNSVSQTFFRIMNSAVTPENSNVLSFRFQVRLFHNFFFQSLHFYAVLLVLHTAHTAQTTHTAAARLSGLQKAFKPKTKFSRTKRFKFETILGNEWKKFFASGTGSRMAGIARRVDEPDQPKKKTYWTQFIWFNNFSEKLIMRQAGSIGAQREGAEWIMKNNKKKN